MHYAHEPNSRLYCGTESCKKRKIAEFVWVHNVVRVRTDKVTGQCAMPYRPTWPV